MTDEVQSAARSASRSRPFQIVARLGYAVNGLLHILIGAIAIGIARGAGGEADASGALSGLASTPGGVFVLWTIVIGLAALGLWQVAEAILVPSPDPKKKWGHRAIELGKAVAYLAIAGTALIFAMGGSSDSGGDAQGFTSAMLATPGGVVVLVIVGLGICVIGGFFVVRGVTKKFTEDLTVPSGTVGRVVVGLGIFGYVAKGIALGVVGILFLVAAFTVDASESTGLDGALKALVELPFGPAILIFVAIGLIAHGLYSFVRARRARL
jgi:hypothetical protein